MRKDPDPVGPKTSGSGSPTLTVTVSMKNRGPYFGGQYVTCVQNSWVEIFNMMDLAINNLTQQNKELKRTVNELGSKVNKVSIIDDDDEDVMTTLSF